MGSYSFAALYQQSPMPADGALFKREYFGRIVDHAPAGLLWYRGYDLAVSTKTSADYAASFRIALDKKTGDLYIADGFRGRLEFPDQRKYIVGRIREERDTEHGIEEALHGQGFVQELWREEKLGTSAFRGVRVTVDKYTRAHSLRKPCRGRKNSPRPRPLDQRLPRRSLPLPKRRPRRPGRRRQPRRPDDGNKEKCGLGVLKKKISPGLCPLMSGVCSATPEDV